jgi:putative acetyltransferase
MFGLERVSPEAMELRRMYVAPELRRRGIAGAMLAFAETECARRRFATLELSTSELQREALAFYRKAGYVLEREEVAAAASGGFISASGSRN